MRHSTRSRSWRSIFVVLAGLALIAGACGDDDDDDDDASSDTGAATDTTAEGGSETSAAGGGGGTEDLSGETVNVQGTELASEAQSTEAGFAPFEEQSGVDIVYAGSRDFETNIAVAAEAGNLPDVALFPQPGGLLNLAEYIVPVPADIVSELEANFDPGWFDIVTQDGNILGIPSKADAKSLVWYSPTVFEENGYEIPTTWDELIALQDQAREDGIAPWCVGIESGDATGWPFTDWMEDVVLRQAGPEVYDQWVNHEIPFNDPAILAAAETVGEIWFTDGNVLGGRDSIVSTGFGAAGLPVLEGQCLMHRQGNFFSANFIDADPDATFGPDGDVNVFYLPTMSDEFGDVFLVAGGYAVAFNDRPATLETLRWMASPGYANGRIGSGLGGYLSANTQSDTSLYPNDLERTMADTLVTADPVRFDASDQMPAEVNSAFWSFGTDYVSGAIDAQEFVDSVEEVWAGLE